MGPLCGREGKEGWKEEKGYIPLKKFWVKD